MVFCASINMSRCCTNLPLIIDRWLWYSPTNHHSCAWWNMYSSGTSLSPTVTKFQTTLDVHRRDMLSVDTKRVAPIKIWVFKFPSLHHCHLSSEYQIAHLQNIRSFTLLFQLFSTIQKPHQGLRPLVAVSVPQNFHSQIQNQNTINSLWYPWVHLQTIIKVFHIQFP